MSSFWKRPTRYLAELIDEVGEPSDEAIAKAEALARRIQAHIHPAQADRPVQAD